MPDKRITEDPIDLADFKDALTDPSVGGHAVFVGTVRDRHRGAYVERMDYEAYAPMAVKVFECLAAEAAEKFGVTACRIVHRIGSLAPGDVAVVVMASAEHRKEAFRACEYVVDELKRRAPIWKREWYRGGRSEWQGDKRNVELDR